MKRPDDDELRAALETCAAVAAITDHVKDDADAANMRDGARALMCCLAWVLGDDRSEHNVKCFRKLITSWQAKCEQAEAEVRDILKGGSDD